MMKREDVSIFPLNDSFSEEKRNDPHDETRSKYTNETKCEQPKENHILCTKPTVKK